MAENNTEGRWVTLDNGVHLFIKKGQTLDDAIEKLETGTSNEEGKKKIFDEATKKVKERKELIEKNEKDPNVIKFSNKDEFIREFNKKYGTNYEFDGNDAVDENGKDILNLGDGINKEDLEKQLLKRRSENNVAKMRQHHQNIREGKEKIEDEDYKGYSISHNFYGNGEYSVQFEGDDILFDSAEDAKAFIDRETNTEEKDDYRNLSAEEYGQKYGKTDELKKSAEIKRTGDVKADIKNGIRNYFSTFNDDEYDDYIGGYVNVDTEERSDGRTKIEVRGEFGYNEFDKIIEKGGLDAYVQAIDKDAYFEQDEPGIISAYVDTKKLKNFKPKETQKKTEKLDPATQRVKDYNLKHPHYVEYEMDGKFENGYYTDEEYNKLKNKSWIKITDHKEVDKETGKYGNEKPKGSKEKIDIGGKSYPVKDKKFLKGRTATASNPYGLEKVRTVTYKNGEKYDIYDVGFGNMESNEKFAVLVED